MAAYLAAVTYPLCWISYEARNYALYVLCGASAWLFLVRAMKSGRKRDWLGFAALLALTWYSFYYGFYVGVGLATFFFLSRPNAAQLRRFLCASSISVLLYAPWIPALIRQISAVQGWADRAHPPSWSTVELLRACGRAVSLYGPWNPLGHDVDCLFSFLPYTETLFAALGIMLAIFAMRRFPFDNISAHSEKTRRFFWATWACGLAFILSSQFTALVGAYARLKYTVFLGVAWSALVALALSCVRPRLRSVAFCGLVVIGTFSQYYLARVRPTDDWRGAATLVDRGVREGECVVTNGPSESRPYLHYTRLSEPPPIYRATGGAQRRLDSLVEEVNTYRGVWLIWDCRLAREPHSPRIEKNLRESGYRRVLSRDFPRRLRVAYYRKTVAP
jgi:hypothetical protein